MPTVNGGLVPKALSISFSLQKKGQSPAGTVPLACYFESRPASLASSECSSADAGGAQKLITASVASARPRATASMSNQVLTAEPFAEIVAAIRKEIERSPSRGAGRNALEVTLSCTPFRERRSNVRARQGSAAFRAERCQSPRSSALVRNTSAAENSDVPSGRLKECEEAWPVIVKAERSGAKLAHVRLLAPEGCCGPRTKSVGTSRKLRLIR